MATGSTTEAAKLSDTREQIDQEHQEATKKICQHFNELHEVALAAINAEKSRVLSENDGIATQRHVTNGSSHTKPSPPPPNDSASHSSAQSSSSLLSKPVFNCYDKKSFENSLKNLLTGVVRLVCHAHRCILSTPVGGVMCVVNSSVSVVLTAYDQTGNKISKGGDKITAHIPDYSTDSNITCALQDNHNGSYTITFTAPETWGRYELLIYSHGTDQESRLSSIVRVYNASGQPHSIIPHEKGRYCAIKGDSLIVSSRETKQLSCFKLSDYTVHQQIDKFEFKKPRGIVVYGNDLLVADAIRNMVVKITDTGSYCVIESLLDYPLSMCLDEKEEKLYVANMEGKCIDVYEVKDSGIYPKVDRIDLPHNPYDLAFDADMNLHIACGEPGNTDGIIVCNRSGEHQPLSGYGRGELNGPGGIAIDKNGFIYTTEYTTSGRLVVFNPKGHKVFSSASFTFPMGVCVSDDGRVFVACNMQDGVLVF